MNENRARTQHIFFLSCMIKMKWIHFFLLFQANRLNLTQVHFMLLYINFNMVSVIFLPLLMLSACFLKLNAKIWASIFHFDILCLSENFLTIFSSIVFLPSCHRSKVILASHCSNEVTTKTVKICADTMHVKANADIISSYTVIIPMHTMISHCSTRSAGQHQYT